MKTWGVEQGDLTISMPQHAKNPVPSGLGGWRNDSEFLVQSLIEQCAFADIGAADNHNCA